MSEHNLPSDKKIRKTAKAQLTERAIADLPELQEEDLRDFYAAVMESGRDDLDLGGEIPQVEAPGRRSKVDRRKILDGLSHRLLPSPDRAGPSTSTTTTAVAGPTDDSADMDIVSKLVAELRALVPQPGDTGRVSLGLISRTEWNVLLDQSARYGPAYEAEEVLQLMTVSLGDITHDEGRANEAVAWDTTESAAGDAGDGGLRAVWAGDGRR